MESSKRAKAPGGNNVGQAAVAHCLVDGCDADLSQCKDYHRRHKVCEAHSKTPKFTISGREQRFCQQCSRFHSLVEFDEGKRSCRKRLDGHNRRRRKPQPECIPRNVFSTLQHHGGDGDHLLCFSSPQIPPPSAVLTSSWAAPAENDNMLYSTTTHQLNYMNPPSSSDPNASHCALSLLSPAPQFGLNHHPQPHTHNLHYPFVHDSSSSAPLHISAPILFHQTTAAEGGSSTAPQSHQTGLTFTWE